LPRRRDPPTRRRDCALRTPGRGAVAGGDRGYGRNVGRRRGVPREGGGSRDARAPRWRPGPRDDPPRGGAAGAVDRWRGERGERWIAGSARRARRRARRAPRGTRGALLASRVLHARRAPRHGHRNRRWAPRTPRRRDRAPLRGTGPALPLAGGRGGGGGARGGGGRQPRR